MSSLGTYGTLLGLPTLVVIDLHGDATAVGWLTAARWLPYLVLGLLVGPQVDRARRRPLLVATDRGQALLLTTLQVAWALGRPSLPLVLLVVMSHGVASLVNRAAPMSFVPRLVGRADPQRAHVRIDGADAVASNAGPALGGLLVSLVAAPLAVLVNAASYLVSTVAVAGVRVAEPARGRGGRGDGPPGATPASVRGRALRHEVAEGLRWVHRGSHRGRFALSTHVFLGNAAVVTVVAPFALTRLGLSAWLPGLAASAGGARAVVETVTSTAGGRRLGIDGAVVAAHVVPSVGAPLTGLQVSSSAPDPRCRRAQVFRCRAVRPATLPAPAPLHRCGPRSVPSVASGGDRPARRGPRARPRSPFRSPLGARARRARAAAGAPREAAADARRRARALPRRRGPHPHPRAGP